MARPQAEPGKARTGIRGQVPTDRVPYVKRNYTQRAVVSCGLGVVPPTTSPDARLGRGDAPAVARVGSISVVLWQARVPALGLKASVQLLVAVGAPLLS